MTVFGGFDILPPLCLSHNIQDKEATVMGFDGFGGFGGL